MSATNVNVRLTIPWASKPLSVVAGVSIVFTMTILDGGTASSPTVKAYKGTTDVSTTVFPAGSATASTSVITLPAATGLVGGFKYVIAVTFTLGGNVHVKKFQLNVQKATAKQ